MPLPVVARLWRELQHLPYLQSHRLLLTRHHCQHCIHRHHRLPLYSCPISFTCSHNGSQSSLHLHYSPHTFFTDSVLHNTAQDATQPLTVVWMLSGGWISGWYGSNRSEVWVALASITHTHTQNTLFSTIFDLKFFYQFTKNKLAGPSGRAV